MEHDGKSQGASQGDVAVFKRLLQIFPVHIRREGGTLQIHHIGDGDEKHEDHEDIDVVRPLLHIPEQGVEKEHQYQPEQDGKSHVIRRVDAQIHAGDGGEQDDEDAGDHHRGLFQISGRRAEGGEHVLGVPRGEGISPGVCPGRFHDGKAGIPDPGARHPAQDLQKLIDGGAEKTHGQHVVAAGFADAPEHDDAHRQENKFSAAVGDLFHHRGDRRGADAF